MKKCIVMHSKDTVATALDGLKPHETVSVLDADMDIIGKLDVRQSIPFGHKISLLNHAIDDVIVKYGCVIGKAIDSIGIGDYVHVHNVESVYKMEGEKHE